MKRHLNIGLYYLVRFLLAALLEIEVDEDPVTIGAKSDPHEIEVDEDP